MDPNTWCLLQNNQLADRRASPSSVPLTTPAGHYIPPCPTCGGTAVRHLSFSNYECQNGGSCHGCRFTHGD
jgi:hypothetical protein